MTSGQKNRVSEFINELMELQVYLSIWAFKKIYKTTNHSHGKSPEDPKELARHVAFFLKLPICDELYIVRGITKTNIEKFWLTDRQIDAYELIRTIKERETEIKECKNEYLELLSTEISSEEQLMKVLKNIVAYHEENGCLDPDECSTISSREGWRLPSGWAPPPRRNIL